MKGHGNGENVSVGTLLLKG